MTNQSQKEQGRKRCEYCGHLIDEPSNRSMALDVVDHGRKIVEFLLREGFTMGHLCNFCYTHVQVFRSENKEQYDNLLLEYAK